MIEDGHVTEVCSNVEDFDCDPVFVFGCSVWSDSLIGLGTWADIGPVEGDMTGVDPDLTTVKTTVHGCCCSAVSVCSCWVSVEIIAATDGGVINKSPSSEPSDCEEAAGFDVGVEEDCRLYYLIVYDYV